MKMKAILLAAALITSVLFAGCSNNSAKPSESAVSSESISQAESSIPSEESSEESSEDTSADVSDTSAEQGEGVDAHWFDDAEFIGDSVTLKLSYYADNGSLGDAKFLCGGSLGYNNCQMGIDEEGNVHPEYEGDKYTIFDGSAMLNPKKMFIMLGMNDIGLYGVDGAAEAMEVVLDKLKEKCPDTVIYVQSVTPMLENMQLTYLNNTTIAEFDSKAEAFCNEMGYHYLDIAPAVGDGYGNLVYEYCSDATAMGLHFSDAGCYQWVEYLKNHV